ncbi:uncharacterized protein BP5553_00128 [Venustampulla echinocandica]|uniref:Uncharacterized protein n=1 Tax=Venustampulla echinocandica TaxID=2656787 RepID=A0A370TXA9_9HELO|nr:uncharacterized protein BP5553_00128 [Venustampulla echinocandica]RDL40149.1 hypothetical protein BP5553_00128 [Venustampulla echinocandica]
MRLIKADTIQIYEFPDVKTAPAFAILSHTWSDQECSLRDMDDPGAKSKTGYMKIKYCCEQALKDGFEWAWVDTCCIDKTSSAELSEAINSMFRWYRTAAICYAYLSDVANLSELERSRWFTRGWTLQELVAPREIVFYSSDWTLLGSKLKISDKLCKITNIDAEVLATGAFHHVSIAGRMSWAASRQTTRVEDLAYCLMGIFDINMPLLYGEGKKSFIRLQEEILRVSDDSSLFAWGLPANIRSGHDFFATQDYADGSKLRGLFAESPAAFKQCHRIQPLENWKTPAEAIETKGGVEITLPVFESGLHLAAAMPFTLDELYDSYLCIPLMRGSNSRVARWGELVQIPVSGHSLEDIRVAKWSTERLLISPPVSVRMQPQAAVKHFDISGMSRPKDNLNYILEEVYCLPHARYSAEDGEVTLSEMKEGPHAVLFFTQNFKSQEIAELNSGKNKAEVKSKLHQEGSQRYGRTGSEIAGIKGLRVVELNSRQPRFAVLLGRNNTADYGSGSSGSWMKFIHILDENKADEDFHSLLQRNAELVRYCATRSQIISALAHQEAERSFLWDSSKDTKYGCWIQHREEHFSVQKFGGRRLPTAVYKHHKNVRDVFVDISFQAEWRNFMELKIVYSMKIYAEEDRWKKRSPRVDNQPSKSIARMGMYWLLR